MEYLCYVERRENDFKLYFGNKKAEQMRGCDWNDKPYEYNAGEPYDYSSTLILELQWDAKSPCTGYLNSPYSVEQINAENIPWIKISIDMLDMNMDDIEYAIMPNDSPEWVIEIVRNLKMNHNYDARIYKEVI